MNFNHSIGCNDFYDYLLQHPEIIKSAKSSEKYDHHQTDIAKITNKSAVKSIDNNTDTEGFYGVSTI